MKNNRYRWIFFVWLPGILLGLLLLAGPALAGDEPAGWRSAYDEVMLWVNFAIFVLVIVKFGRAPIASFLKGQKEAVADEISQIEAQKQQAEDAVQEVRLQLQASSDRLEKIKARIVSQGEKRKAVIIARAHAESETLLNSSKTRIDGHIAGAREQLRIEMIDAAIGMALKRLPGEMTDQDNANIVDEYLTQVLPQ
ncbi:MAG: ATP synthase F0 subunit B [Deltaproteobacteria bacterium]|nr:MAG: ATP synthase F0 subunit B [Deltaproteobacteria bacterium]